MKRNRRENDNRRSTAITLFAFACLLIVVVRVSAQGVPIKAAKFDEIELPPGLSYAEIQETTDRRLKRFGDSAKREKRFPYVLHYRARIKEERDRWIIHNSIMTLKSTLGREDTVILDGGIREVDTLELWFVPKGADLPTPTPAFQRSEAIDCPSVVAYSGLHFDKSKHVIFKARPIENSESYDWTVTDGKIVGKNGGSTVEVDVTSAKTDRITAFLEVRGIPLGCKNTTMADASFGNTPRLVDQFGRVPNGDMRARLDNFLAMLAQNPDLQGYVYNYGGRINGEREMAARRRLFSNHFYFRKFDTSRVTIVDAGYREVIATDLLVVPRGVNAPRPTPTVDSSFIVNRAVRQTRRR